MMIHISVGIMVLMAPFSSLASLSIFIMLHKFQTDVIKLILKILGLNVLMCCDPRMRFVCRAREKQKFVLDLPYLRSLNIYVLLTCPHAGIIYTPRLTRTEKCCLENKASTRKFRH